MNIIKASLTLALLAQGAVAAAVSPDSSVVLARIAASGPLELGVPGELPPAPPVPAPSAVVSSPENDPAFLILRDGRDLARVAVEGSRLRLARGSGARFGQRQAGEYARLIAADTAELQWVLMDLDSHQVLRQSAQPSLPIFGASVSKMFAAGTLLNQQAGNLSDGQLQAMADMLVVSSNEAWLSIQAQAGGGSADAGREANYRFTQMMGYSRTRGFQGTWNGLHGNELTASELAEYLYDIYHGRFPGADTLWKLIHTCRTGGARGRKYLPDTLAVGGKTGTYSGESVDPQTGAPIRVAVANHALVFRAGGRQYGLAILANTGSDETAALLAGGLYRELAGR